MKKVRVISGVQGTGKTSLANDLVAKRLCLRVGVQTVIRHLFSTVDREQTVYVVDDATRDDLRSLGNMLSALTGDEPLPEIIVCTQCTFLDIPDSIRNNRLIYQTILL